uniref:Uncharacterized protein n=1 Tax=Ditylenchus dipsaci TaxID=166011 RepID=A0A915DMM5_9BILA
MDFRFFSSFGESPSDAHAVVKDLLKHHKDHNRKCRSDLGLSITVDKAYELGNAIEHLDKKFHEHTQMLRQNEGSLISGTNTVLEYDSAKNKTDKLVEILKAKIVWANTSEEIQLLEPTDRSLKYQKLVSLQKSFDVLHKQQKDEFLSWFSSATVLAIDSNDAKQLESLKEKYLMLNRSKAFEETFGSFARNKIKCFIDEKGNEHKVWDILQEVFSVWKRCYRLADSFIGPHGSKLIASNLYEGVLAKWSVILDIVTSLTTTSSNDPFVAAREIGKICNDFLEYVSSEGDEHIAEVSNKICQKIFSVMGDGYRKHVTSLLLCTINKITAPEKSSRFRHNWVFPYLEEIHSCMREMINEARSTFGPNFSPHIVPSFEEGIKELNSLIRNQDILNIKRENADVRTKRTVQENTEDKISAICVTGALVNIVHEVNRYILECYSEAKFQGIVEPCLISNVNLLDRLNKK